MVSALCPIVSFAIPLYRSYFGNHATSLTNPSSATPSSFVLLFDPRLGRSNTKATSGPANIGSSPFPAWCSPLRVHPSFTTLPCSTVLDLGIWVPLPLGGCRQIPSLLSFHQPQGTQQVSFRFTLYLAPKSLFHRKTLPWTNFDGLDFKRMKDEKVGWLERDFNHEEIGRALDNL